MRLIGIACLVVAVFALNGCQTDEDRRKDVIRLNELGRLPYEKFCSEPVLNEVEKIAKRGNGQAGDAVASCYERGANGRVDLDEAMKWYRKAQEAGYGDAANGIENLKACIAAKGPAEHGDKKQAAVLAKCFERGAGGPKDVVEARKWDLIAGPDNARIGVMYELTPEQEAEAQKRFAAFQPK